MKIKLLLLLFPIVISAQSFTVTTAGLVNSEDNTKNYVVVEDASLNSKELYDKAKYYLLDTYSNPEEAIVADIEGELLRAKTNVSNIATINNVGVILDAKATYDLELKFKDGKIKVTIANLDISEENQGMKVNYQSSIWKGYPIYNKKGKLRLPDTKEAIENHFNGVINKLKSNIKGLEDEKW